MQLSFSGVVIYRTEASEPGERFRAEIRSLGLWVLAPELAAAIDGASRQASYQFPNDEVSVSWQGLVPWEESS